MKRKNRSSPSLGWFNRFMLWLNILLVAVTLLGYLSPYTDPKTFWPIAFLGLAYPLLLPINLLFIIYWLFLRARVAVLSVLTLLVGWKVLNGTIGFRLPESGNFQKPPGETVRVLTYNVHYFRKFDDPANSSQTRDEIVEIIAGQKPDVICLQEVMTRKSGDYNTIQGIKKRTGLRYSYFVPTVDNSWEAQGLIIFSRFPIVDQQSILFGNTPRGNEAMYADIMAYGKRLRVYNVHFQSIGFQPEDYKYLQEVKGIQTDDVKSSRRIGARLKRAFLLRSEQVKLLKEHTAGCTTPFVVAGDFNDTPGSFAVNYMARGLKNAFREKGSGPGVTYNGEFPNFQIDYIMASATADVASYKIIRKKLSDHYAVRSDLLMFAR